MGWVCSTDGEVFVRETTLETRYRRDNNIKIGNSV
jgi:hypothetical protein